MTTYTFSALLHLSGIVPGSEAFTYLEVDLSLYDSLTEITYTLVPGTPAGELPEVDQWDFMTALNSL